MIPDNMVPDKMVPGKIFPNSIIPDNVIPNNMVPSANLDKMVPSKISDTSDALSEMSLISAAITFKVSDRYEVRSIRDMSIRHRGNKGNLPCRYRMF